MGKIEPAEVRLNKPNDLGGVMTITGNNFGEKVDNNQLLRIAIEYGLPRKQIDLARQAIETTGFSHRYFANLPENETTNQELLDRTVDIGTRLLKDVTGARKWNGFDVFIDTSAFLPTEINRAILDKSGFNPDRIISRSYRIACAGGVAALIDCLTDPELQDTRIVIGCLEPLSALMERNHFLDPVSLAFPSIFSDAYTFIAFEPRNFNINYQKILILPDGGVIKLQTLYNFDQLPKESDQTPPHYQFSNGGEGIFKYSNAGAFLNLIVPDDNKRVSMDGIGTGIFFGNHTAAMIKERLDTGGNPDLLKKLAGKNLVMHPASLPVVKRIAKLLYRGEPKYIDEPKLPFLMDEAQQANGSSATTFNRLRYMIDAGMIDTRLPMVWVAPGVGSAIAYAEISIKHC